MVVAVKASPQFVYTTVGRGYPIYTNGHSFGYTPNQIEEPIQPIQYARRPLLYVNNACRNDQGILVPCAISSAAGPSVYAFNNSPQIVDFLSTTGGVAAPVGLTLKDEETEITAPEDNNLDSIQSVEKREANAEP